MAPKYLDPKCAWLDASAWETTNDRFFPAAVLSQQFTADGQHRIITARNLLLANMMRVDGVGPAASADELKLYGAQQDEAVLKAVMPRFTTSVRLSAGSAGARARRNCRAGRGARSPAASRRSPSSCRQSRALAIS
jgi:hypothetical protein